MKRVLLGIILIVLTGGIYFYLEAGPEGFRLDQMRSQFEMGGGWVIRAAEPNGPPTATPLPAVKPDDHLLIEAVVVPVRHAALSMATSGLVAAVLVYEGEAVTAGQVIARLDNAGQQVAITEAMAKLRAAQARLDQLRDGKRPEEIALAEAALAIAQANLTKVTEAPPSLEVTPLELTVAKAIAEAEVRRAEAELALAQAGARPEEIQVAEAEVTEAAANLQQRELELAATELRAPFAGVIAALDLEVGEQVMAGAPVVQLADLSAWQLKTADLSELDVVHVQEGAEVSITFDAIPDLTLAGALVSIKPLGENKQGQITYTAVIQPAQHEPRLRWNMTAVVSLRPQAS